MAIFVCLHSMVTMSICLFRRFYPKIPVHPPLLSSSGLPEVFNIMDKINNNKAVSRIENIDESWIDPFVSAGFKIKSGESENLYLREDPSKLKGDSYKSK